MDNVTFILCRCKSMDLNFIFFSYEKSHIALFDNMLSLSYLKKTLFLYKTIRLIHEVCNMFSWILHIYSCFSRIILTELTLVSIFTSKASTIFAVAWVSMNLSCQQEVQSRSRCDANFTLGLMNLQIELFQCYRTVSIGFIFIIVPIGVYSIFLFRIWVK